MDIKNKTLIIKFFFLFIFIFKCTNESYATSKTEGYNTSQEKRNNVNNIRISNQRFRNFLITEIAENAKTIIGKKFLEVGNNKNKGKTVKTNDNTTTTKNKIKITSHKRGHSEIITGTNYSLISSDNPQHNSEYSEGRSFSISKSATEISISKSATESKKKEIDNDTDVKNNIISENKDGNNIMLMKITANDSNIDSNSNETDICTTGKKYSKIKINEKCNDSTENTDNSNNKSLEEIKSTNGKKEKTVKNNRSCERLQLENINSNVKKIKSSTNLTRSCLNFLKDENEVIKNNIIIDNSNNKNINDNDNYKNSNDENIIDDNNVDNENNENNNINDNEDDSNNDNNTNKEENTAYTNNNIDNNINDNINNINKNNIIINNIDNTKKNNTYINNTNNDEGKGNGNKNSVVEVILKYRFFIFKVSPNLIFGFVNGLLKDPYDLSANGWFSYFKIEKIPLYFGYRLRIYKNIINLEWSINLITNTVLFFSNIFAGKETVTTEKIFMSFLFSFISNITANIKLTQNFYISLNFVGVIEQLYSIKFLKK